MEVSQTLKEQISNLPDKPGVYKYFHNETIIYVGKAKNLKKEFLVTLLKIRLVTRHKN